MSKWLFRKGDGNEGNFPVCVVALGEHDCPYAALRALVANEYIAGRSVRRHIIKHIDVDGEREYGIHATVHEGPRGASAYGAAWLTAELQPATDDDVGEGECYRIEKLLDPAALRLYRAELRAR
jgi:hypothetical protein